MSLALVSMIGKPVIEPPPSSSDSSRNAPADGNAGRRRRRGRPRDPAGDAAAAKMHGRRQPVCRQIVEHDQHMLRRCTSTAGRSPNRYRAQAFEARRIRGRAATMVVYSIAPPREHASPEAMVVPFWPIATYTQRTCCLGSPVSQASALIEDRVDTDCRLHRSCGHR